MSSTLTLIAACLSMASIAMSITASGVALASLQSSLGIGITQLQWVLNGFILSFGVLLLPFGALGDRIGQRLPFLVGTVSFALATLVSVFAPSFTMLMIGRFAQGVGAALMAASAPAALTVIFIEEAERKKAFGFLGASGGVGLTLGAWLAGWASALGTWRAAFAIHLPFVVLTLLVALYGFRGTSGTRDQKFDWAGILRSLRNSRFIVACVACVSFTTIWVALFAYVPLQLQTVQGKSAGAAGTVMLGLMLPALVMPLVASRLVLRVSIPVVMAGGFALLAIGLLVLRFGWLHASDAQIVGLVLCGAGAGSLYGLLDYVALSAVPTPQSGMAAGTFNVVRLIGDALGALIPGAIILHTMRTHFAESDSPRVLPDDLLSQLAAGEFAAARKVAHTAAEGDALQRAALDVFQHGMSTALLSLMAIAIVGALLSGLSKVRSA